ncbi:sugar phosphate nucleotidyltransferase [Sphaerochaeta sp.]|uniref:sugar phosphate nucleotidyltransferase n=1 Tax=Sphaerochaeta sp. TaxID=1972642 RepID=UPI003D0A5434
MLNDFAKLIIDASATVKEAMRKLDETALKILFVVDKGNILIGSLSDGDIRRWILKDGLLTASVSEVCYRETFFATAPYNIEDIKDEIYRRKILYVPVVTKTKEVKEFLIWDKLFGSMKRNVVEKLDADVVIMAGGKGTRLEPFTKVLPKPLIPVNDKTILEHIIDKFLDFNVDSFYMSINHKAVIIKAYFEELNPPYSITYITEDKPLGTIGAVRQLAGKIEKELVLTNCDILIDADYHDILESHRKLGNHVTMVASLKQYKIPYGVCKIQNGELVCMKEKPEYDFLVNTGMYIINKEMLELIPEDTYFDATQFLDIVKEKGFKVGVYPISEESWTDIGEWAEYRKAVSKFRL